MNPPSYSHMTLKRPYPFETDRAPEPHYEQRGYARGLTPIDEPLCLLGSVVDVKAQVRRESYNFIHRTYSLGTDQHYVTFDVFPKGDYFELFSNGHTFARLDKAFCSEARRLVGLEVKLQACLERKHLEEVVKAWRSYADGPLTCSVDVNVKSLMSHADKVGHILLSSSIFLQPPIHNPGGETYFNPQILQIEGFYEKSDDTMTEAEDTPMPVDVPDRRAPSDLRSSLTSQDHVEEILDSLSHTNILHEIRTDTNRIKSTLMRQAPNDGAGLHRTARKWEAFCRAHLLARKAQKRFQHVLTKSEALERREARGGILADDMGLGKSLTMLSAIASSLQDAESFVSTPTASAKESSNDLKPSRATLIVVPSTTLIDNWIDEIRTHTFPHKVTFHKHLSTERHVETHLLFEKDVIFTTYATALEDTKRNPSPLSKVHWFRIVLDEAHKIRNQNTKMFKAIQELPAQRRWCLTGTPIQNRLEDLGSLVAFLRFAELARMSTFRTYIITPTLIDRGNSFANLQTVLKTICLRRTRDILGLPQPIAYPRLIKFSGEERRQYTDLYEHYKRQVQMAVSGNGRYASTTLQSIHELRLFCNNGPRRRQDQTHDSDDEILSYLLQLEENACVNCGISIFCIDKEEGRNRDFTTHISTEMLPVAPNEAPLPYPSKLLALLDDIRQAPRDKCIVFSAWKKTLDLAAELLIGAGLKHDIIHGTLSSKQRLKVLKNFKSLMGPNVLLMTLGTGAEGLNLTVATRIYLLEPQWNPFVELQAMARAQRIGQTKQVVCVRYVMEGTIEQSDVLNRQKKKTRLAGGGFKNQNINDSLQFFGVDPTRIQNDVTT
ncbi:unnamed protein product [Alternaria alternata]